MSRDPQTPPEGSRQSEPPRNLDEALSALLTERSARERAEEELRSTARDLLDAAVARGDFEADRDAAVARAEQAEAERDELRKKLGRLIDAWDAWQLFDHGGAEVDTAIEVARAALEDGNDEGTSTTAEVARDAGPEQRNSRGRSRS